MKTLQTIVSLQNVDAELKYLSAILSSSLINFWCINYLADDMNQTYLEKVPVYSTNGPVDTARRIKMVRLVDQMLDSKKQLAAAQSDKDKSYYENKCQSLDRQIDQLVYELYDLTADEIKLVEGAEQ